ncbi:hypothetical protein BG011_001565 [Mortierella polycephala]|uniref:Uncharacterized protein n=1 Tax=Mortierella polycephala TaxID=41804 RepID=A0A9P6PK45_9FUNG|nr:hypothetical protein BG011_001565 [Mortierella polycephala]
MGTSLVPGVLTHMFNYQGDSPFLISLINSANIVLDTGFALGAITSCVLNAILPSNPTVTATATTVDRHGSDSADKDIEEMQVESQSVHGSVRNDKN